jgi:branched-chain amino acid transport system substrate-binding protein
LVDEVGVAAVIGFRSSDEAIHVATSTLIPKGVLGVAALNTSPMITSLPRAPGEPRMIWRTTYSGAETALPIGLLVPEVLEPDLRAAGLAAGEPLRVAFVRQDDAAGLGFADVLFRALRFNGKTALENEGAYREIAYAAGGADAKGEYERVAAKLLAFAPHVVVDFGGDDAFLGIASALERGWKGALRPRYVKASAMGPEVLALIGRTPAPRRRFFSITSVSATAANARFVARYNEAYADGVTRTFSPNSSYDAFYLAAYATYAIGAGQVTGANLARAIPRLLPPGKPIDVGPSGIFEALNALSAGANIDLNGATGALDFDVNTGDASVDLAVLCVGSDARASAPASVESGLVYDAAAKKLRGTLHCP